MTPNYGLPVPFINNVLAALRQTGDPGMLALAAKIDAWLVTGAGLTGGGKPVVPEIIAELAFHRPEQADLSVLGELAYMVGAQVSFGDSEDKVRKAIFNAIDGQKKKGQWLADAKPKIDAITGLSAVLWGNPNDLWPVRLDGDPSYSAQSLWSVRGAGGDGWGIIRTGFGTESIVPGNIYIDLGGNAGNPTAAVLAQVVAAISPDVVPAYYRIFLGYTTAGAFTVYAGGQSG